MYNYQSYILILFRIISMPLAINGLVMGSMKIVNYDVLQLLS